MEKYYKILGLQYPATHEEIKKAFYGLAHIFHPDKLSGNETKFKEINNAYQILTGKINPPSQIYQQPVHQQSEIHFTRTNIYNRHVQTIYDAASGTWFTITW